VIEKIRKILAEHNVLTLSALKQKTLLWESVKEDIVYV
jgi:hypothetical protein